MTKNERLARRIGIAVCEMVVAYSLIYTVFIRQSTDNIFLAPVTAILVILPEMFERLFRCKMCLQLYIFGCVYALSHLCGHVFCLYERLPGYDKVLHTIGGVIFAIVGIYLLYFCSGKKTQPLVCTAIFALCFSMAVSMAWEFFEFGSDRWFGTDMQRDTVVSSINSYHFGVCIGEVGSIDNIESSSINDEKLPFDGYLDLGLTDTMTDMLLETLGAVIVVVIYFVDKGRHSFICSL